MATLRQRRSRKGERRKEEIVAIAARLFAAEGVDRTSMQDIASAAGVTKAAIHYHFCEKEALYEAVVLSRAAETYALALAAVDAAHTPLAKLEAFMMAAAKRIEDDRSAWIVSADLFRFLKSSHRSRAVIAARDRMESLLRAIIAEGVADGTFRKVDPATVGRLLFGALNALPRWHDPNGKQSIRAVIADYLDILLEGVRAPR
ncbi:TetR/AcrR family transcriptional regulator [Acuticoccus sp. M5D2P5]|uniref:TetR/AcrR family transcriptional regulator n=1 Tax=Acuticoccus kalidii TaxID=2910977 RepID=UPI001F1BA3DD|nr:TetR/AcrR family transcriptional regulator [Acuticoccus kalidii]MCF3932451.1 TetR/AcrR family transcriptional regulator [Acuticoccus kalidii]